MISSALDTQCSNAPEKSSIQTPRRVLTLVFGGSVWESNSHPNSLSPTLSMALLPRKNELVPCGARFIYFETVRANSLGVPGPNVARLLLGDILDRTRYSNVCIVFG
jgi:hypothetical protein